jgi:hypothetical protein
VANADFEGGDDDHGYGDCIFWVIYAQPSHMRLGSHRKVSLEFYPSPPSGDMSKIVLAKQGEIPVCCLVPCSTQIPKKYG